MADNGQPGVPPAAADPSDAQRKKDAQRSFALSAVVLAAGLVVGWLALGDASIKHRTLLVVSNQWSSFGALFVLALAIERAIEPFSDYLGPNSTTASRAAATAHATARAAAATAEDKTAADEATKSLTQARRLTGTVTFAVATALGWLFAGGLKVLLLSAIVDVHKGAIPNRFWDLVVTGLVIGAGTKPLHDLVSNLQKSSAAKSKKADKKKS